jgi:hypothetical protein
MKSTKPTSTIPLRISHRTITRRFAIKATHHTIALPTIDPAKVTHKELRIAVPTIDPAKVTHKELRIAVPVPPRKSKPLLAHVPDVKSPRTKRSKTRRK